MAEIKLKIASVVIGSGEGGGSGVAPYYADLPDKPSINGETLSGEMTSEDLGLASAAAAVPTGGTTGQVLAKKSNADNDVQWVNQEGGDTSNLATKTELQQGLSGKQDTISDLSTIRSGAAAGATAYQKPSDGIPSTDLASAAQTSLGKADTSVQQITVGTTTTGNAGTDASVTNSGTSTAPVLNFTIPRGADGQDGEDAVNPFKGWFDAVVTGEAGSRVITSETQNLPANPVVGDYTYVKTWDISGTAPNQTETPIAKIYECTTAGTWSDSGRTADTSNVQTFASSEEVNEVHIVNDLTTGGVEDVLSAEQGKVLNEKIGTILEINDTIALTWTDGYYNYSDNSIKSSDSQKTATIDLTDYDNNCFIRFMGMLSTASGGSAGWAFRDSSHNRIQGAYGGWDYDTSLESATLKEYVMQIPQGAVEFIFSIRFASVSLDDVYFKVQKIYNGSLVDLINALDGRVNDVESIQSKSSEEYDTGSITSDYLVRDKNGNNWYIRKYIDEDEVDIKIELDPTDDITLGIQEVLSNGTTNELVSSKSIDLHWTKTNGSYLVLRFTKPSYNEITVGQVIDAIDSWDVTYKTNTARLKAKNDEVEMPLYGFVSYERSISSNSYFGVLSDIFYTPEQYNLGGFRIIMPDYITLNWTSGDNHAFKMTILEHGGDTAYKNGDVVKFIRKYSYDLMYRFWFYINSPTRHLSLDYVKYLINSGRIKILYTPNDKHKSITQRQSSCEQYVRALQRRIVTATDITNNNVPKIYGTHDLPMFVHCSDIHSDITRLISAMEYARYIQSDAVILTGDYTMRDFNNGAHYLKDIDEKFNPDSVDAGVLSQRIPLLVGTGNHDTGGSGITHAITRSQLIDPFANKYNYMLSANEYLGKDPNNDNAVRDAEVAYYYVDLDIPAPRNGGYVADSQTYNNTQRVRIIMLDIVDGLNNDMSQWAITKAQIDWFINTLNSTPSGVPIFVGMHNGPDKVVAPSVRAAAYEAGGTKRLPYVSDMFTYKAYVDNVYKGLNDTGTYDFNGSPIRQIIDAFISRSQGSGSYSYTGSGTISWSCNFENAEGIFVAYLSGHAHVDYVGYVKDAEQTQLVLGNTCTVCEYGPAGNERGSSNADCVRGSSGSTQDGFNVYVLDMEHKRVGIARIGANMTVDLEPRTACWISFADETIS